MRHLNEFLSTKVINHNVLNTKFPETPDAKQIIDCLIANGFVQLKETFGQTYASMAQAIKDNDCPAFITGSYDNSNKWSQFIMFGTSEKHIRKPFIFFIRTSNELIKQHESTCFMYWTKSSSIRDESKSNSKKLKSYKEMLEMIKKYI